MSKTQNCKTAKVCTISQSQNGVLGFLTSPQFFTSTYSDTFDTG